MRNRYAFALLFGCLLTMTAGCFSVTDTGGLERAYQDIDLAASKASELKALPAVSDADRAAAADLYRNAKAKVNAYLQGAITRAADYDVNEPVEAYERTGAPADVQAFQARVNVLRGPAPASTATVAAVATLVINEIVNLNNQAQKAAYDRFTSTVTQYMMENYEDIPPGASAPQ